MSANQSFDEQLLQRLPLPLAQLCRRSQNAKTPLEQHLAAYYLWEGALKLLGATAVVEYAALKDRDPEIAEKLKNLARPAVGHWWEFVRRLVPVLADKGDKGFGNVRDLVLGRARDDMPRAAGLFAALAEALEGKAGARTTVRLTELFDRLVTYRNREIGHGAAGQRPMDFYRRMSGTLSMAFAQILAKLDVVAGRRIIYVGDVRRLGNGGWLIERYLLVNETPRRLEPLLLAEKETPFLPRPECVYLEGRRDMRIASPFPTLRALHPLVHFEPDAGKLFFLNARRGKQQVEYLCYSTGETQVRDISGDQRELLGQILNQPIDPSVVEVFAARSLAQEKADDVQPAASPVGRAIGEYELLSRLGQGGMGVVYRAWQPSLGRQVALKCMLRVNDPKGEARFAREIRALGRIEHPNVVKVFTSGADGDQWFYAMELIEGAELSRVCEHLTGSSAADIDADRWQNALTAACAQVRTQETQLSQSKTDPGQKIPVATLAPPAPASTPHGIPIAGRDHVRQVVDIVRQVSNAVHALHEAGVVHRDIKPGNIMLTADGSHPVLMDLGLAQLADETDGKLTRTRQFVGTLRYASPEQILAVGDVDRRTDVYSLGVTLWELLTLRPAFDANDNMPTPDLMLKIQTTDMESPRKYNRNLPRDLTAIVMKCVEKDRTQRYATAADLAADLGRFLNGEPVMAQPPSFRYVAGKFVRRHKAPLATAAAIFLLLIAGVVASFFRISAERSTAVQASNRATEALAQAEQNFAESRATVDAFLTDISGKELPDVPGTQQVREQLARKALDRYLRYAERRPDDREVAAGLARVHLALGKILGQTGRVEDTLKHMNEAIAIQDRLLQAGPASSALRLGIATARYELGQFYWSVDNYEKARPLVDIVIPDLEKLAKEEPANLEARFRLAGAFNLLGNVSRRLEPPSQKAAYQRSRELFVELLDHDFRKVDVLKGVAAPLHNLAMGHADLGDHARALDLYRLSHKYDEMARKLAPGRPDVESNSALTLSSIAGALRKLGQEDEALKYFDQAIRRHRAVVGANPEVSRYRWLFADDLLRYAKGMSSAKKFAESQKLYEESAQVLEELIERVPDRAMYGSKLIDVLEQLSTFHQGSKGESAGKLIAGGNLAERIRYLDRSVAVGRKLSPRFPRDVAIQYQFMYSLGRRAEMSADNTTQDETSLPIYEEMLATFRKGIWEVQQQPDSFEVSQMLRFLQSAVLCARRLKRNDKVLEFTDLGYQMGKGCTRLDGVNALGNMLLNRADALRESGRSAEAIRAYADAVRLGKPALEKAPWHWWIRHDIRQAYRGLAELYEKTGDFQNEVLAHRDYLKVWGGPMQGMEIDAYIDSKTPATAAEARRLRAFRKLEPGMYKVSIPCDFNGVKYPFYVYLTNFPYPNDPLADQARWLAEVRGGKITEEYREAFRTVHKLAHEHKVPFARVGYIVPNSFQYKASLVDVFNLVIKNPENRRSWLNEKATGLESALAITPNAEFQQARAKILDDLKAIGPGTQLNPAADGEIVLQFAGKLAETDPFDNVLTKSHHQVHTLKMAAGAAYTIDLASTEFDNYLRLEDSTGRQLASDDDSGGSLNARIIHIAAKDDAVRVIVTSYKSGATGSYLLTIRESRTEGLMTIAGQLAELEALAKTQRDRADKLQAQKKPAEYRQALSKEFEIRGQQTRLSTANLPLRDAQAKVAAEIARSFLEAQEPGGAMIWLANAGPLAPSESLLQLAEYLEKGTNIKADPETANHYRYQGLIRRGMKAYRERRFADALPDLKKASELPDGTPADHNQLGMCYGKLGRWEEAINSYQRAFDLEANAVQGTGTMLNLLEAYITGERPADGAQFVNGLVKKNWLPKAEDTARLHQRLAMFYGFRAIILQILERDASEMEKLMRDHAALTNMDQASWGWQEINDWLKTTKLAPDRKVKVEQLLADLKGITLLDAKTAFTGFSGTLSSNRARKVHSVPLIAGKTYQVDATGEFDTYLRIEDSQLRQIVTNNDANSLAASLNSRVIFTPSKEDTFRMIVTSFKTGVAGKFTLRLQEVVKIGKEDVIKGVLAAKDEKYLNGYSHKHKIQLEAGRPYTIELHSETYDTRLLLYDSTGTKKAAQNDGISPSNYRLSRIDFTPQVTGSYVVLVTSFDAGKTGPYTLRVQGYGPTEKK